jgi:hypothetical protein
VQNQGSTEQARWGPNAEVIQFDILRHPLQPELSRVQAALKQAAFGSKGMRMKASSPGHASIRLQMTTETAVAAVRDAQLDPAG